MKIGYIRVSTREQNMSRQVDGLTGHCDELVTETVSAVADSRPEFESLIERLQEGDSLVVWSLDRAFRSVMDALGHVEA